jgi:hypothetical protein
VILSTGIESNYNQYKPESLLENNWHTYKTINASIDNWNLDLHSEGLILTLLEELGQAGTEREGSALRHQDQNRTAQMPRLHGIERGKALVNQRTSS